MTIDEFTNLVEKQFMDGGVRLTPETDFRDNDDFDSLVGMAIIVVIKEHFKYDMTESEFLSCHTTQDLYNAIFR